MEKRVKSGNNISPPKGRHWRCSPSELDKLEKEGLIEWSKTGYQEKRFTQMKGAGKNSGYLGI